jgi:chromosome segregation ATPase
MAQSLEKRMTDIEYIIAHLPDDLNARFAGVDVKIATIRETQLLHTQRFSTLERKIDALEIRMDGLESRMERLEGRMDGLESRFERLESRFDGLEAKFDHLGTKVDLILARLPAP